MKRLEFWRHVSIGRYVEADSPVHRLSPVAKYLWLLAVVIPASVSTSSLVVLVATIIPLIIAKIARVRLRFLLGGILPLLPFLGLAATFQVVFSWPGDKTAVLIALGPVSISAREAVAVASMALRFVAMMTSIGLFTSV
ncbi:MAG: hypothetical protein JXM71_06605, partial [Spirochaetales bacterium]|nr:hypothetical protein [Spirochaetales bacterium]